MVTDLYLKLQRNNTPYNNIMGGEWELWQILQEVKNQLTQKCINIVLPNKK